jgi:hypothetical protein
MDQQPPPKNDAARVVGVIYLTFCAGVPALVFLYLHPASIFCRIGLGIGVAAGLIAALLARIPDPAAKPIRWGLLWLALGLVAGPGLTFAFAYVWVVVLGFWI